MSKYTVDFTEVNDHHQKRIEKLNNFYTSKYIDPSDRVPMIKLAEELDISLPILYGIFFPKFKYVFVNHVSKEHREYVKNEYNKLPHFSHGLFVKIVDGPYNYSKHYVSRLMAQTIKERYHSIHAHHKEDIATISNNINDKFNTYLTKAESRSNLSLYVDMELEFEGVFMSKRLVRHHNTKFVSILIHDLSCPLSNQKYSNHVYIHIDVNNVSNLNKFLRLEKYDIVRFKGIVYEYDMTKYSIKDIVYISHRKEY